MEVDKKTLGRRIKDIRVNEGDTLEKFSNKINKQSNDIIKSGKSNVSRWEKGENIPNDITLKAIADIGKVSVNELLYGDLKQHVYNVLQNELIENGKFSLKVEEYLKLVDEDILNIPEEHIRNDILQIKSEEFLNDNIEKINGTIKDNYVIKSIDNIYGNGSLIIELAVRYVNHLINNLNNRIIYDEDITIKLLKDIICEGTEDNFENEIKYIFHCRISLETTYDLGTTFHLVPEYNTTSYVDLDYVTTVVVNIYVEDAEQITGYQVGGFHDLLKEPLNRFFSEDIYNEVKECIVSETLKSDELKDFNGNFDELNDNTI